jgi:hypothetical protein
MEELIDASPRGDLDDFLENNAAELEDESKKLVKVHVSLDDTLKQLKDCLAKQLNVPTENQILTFEGSSFPDLESTLKDCGIEHKSVVTVADISSSKVWVISIVCQDREPSHAMVLIGCLNRGGFLKKRPKHRLYILWNSWPNMPLVAVSLGYLVACRCQIHFMRADLSPDCVQGLESTEGLACDCAPLDHAEDTIASNCTFFEDE